VPQMKKFKTLAYIIIGIFVSKLAFCQELKIVNSGEDFKQFWSQAKGKNFAEQNVLWLTFEEKYQDIYDTLVFPKTNSNWEKDREAVLEKSFGRMPANENKLFESLDSASSVAWSQVKRFKKVFPDLEDGTPVIFLPVSQANGTAITLPTYGRRALVIGLDTILNLHNNLDVVFSHEFFHIYHFKQLENTAFGETMSTQLWVEGFATFESSVLNPGADYDAIFMDANLASACTSENVREWSKQYLKIYTFPVDTNLLKSWFRVSGTEMPKRRGYCVGFNVIKLLAKETPLATMAKWGEQTYVERTGWALNQLVLAK
jgi:hypothetical protein